MSWPETNTSLVGEQIPLVMVCDNSCVAWGSLVTWFAGDIELENVNTDGSMPLLVSTALDLAWRPIFRLTDLIFDFCRTLG